MKVNTFFNIVVFGGFGLLLIAGAVDAVGAGNSSDWRASITGKIVDIDPIANNGNVGLFFEVQGNSSSKWFWIWKDDIVGSWPSRGDFGTFYVSKDKEDDKYKWEDGSAKSQSKSSSPKKTVPTTITVKAPTWTDARVSTPPIDKTVLVKYKNGKTITTAYINSEKQWKLETDRERVAGGREIETIAMWRDINE